MKGPTLVDQQVRRQSSLRAAQPIEPVQLQTTVSTLYTAKDDADFWIQHLWAANVTGGALTLTLYFVPDGGTAGAANTAMATVSIAANTSVVLDVAVNHRLPVGASLQALCSSNDGINIGGWGYDQTGDA